jgi:Ni/Co efflux regulator RcnB
MKSTATLIAALLAASQACWMLESAHAQPGEHGKPEKSQKHNKQQQRDDQGPEQRQKKHDGMHAEAYRGAVQIGGYFREQQREAARDYYGRSENQGFCPPGLAKKVNGCLPPGQAKKWRQGYPLPADVVYYEVPRSVVVTLGVPPSGYRYVRVASDILLIAVGTSMVVDAIEDLVR